VTLFCADPSDFRGIRTSFIVPVRSPIEASAGVCLSFLFSCRFDKSDIKACASHPALIRLRQLNEAAGKSPAVIANRSLVLAGPQPRAKTTPYSSSAQDKLVRKRCPLVCVAKVHWYLLGRRGQGAVPSRGPATRELAPFALPPSPPNQTPRGQLIFISISPFRNVIPRAFWVESGPVRRQVSTTNV